MPKNLSPSKSKRNLRSKHGFIQHHYGAGFTLIELLIVMAILAILSAIGLGNFTSARIKARDAKRKNDLETIAKSLEAFANDHAGYPNSSSGEIVCNPPDACAWGAAFSDGTSLYAAELPSDDLSPTREYRYEKSGSDYLLYAALENENDPAIDSDLTQACGTGATCNYKITSGGVN